MNQNGEVGLNISYSVEQEIWRVQNTLKKLSWYLEQGYKPRLPEGITIDSGDEDVIKAVQDEYVEADYAENAKRLQKEWVTLPKGFGKIQDEPSFHLKNEYSVVLTKYGVGGSYNPNLNQVIIKINTSTQISRVGTAVHEIVHMTIQYLIDQYNVRHWYKERLVDLILEHYFPGLKKMQNIQEDVSIVDAAFEKHFPNMDAIAQSISG